MNNQKKYRCIECFSLFDDYQLKLDLLFCPSCGGHLEEGHFNESERSENTGTREEKQQGDNFDRQSKNHTHNKRLHTHYENLKVARNAPPEVIRAAYRVLSQKYHPDCNPGNAESSRIMVIINASYEVLSDPEKRREHDLWIAQRELTYEEPMRPTNQPRPSAAPQPAPSRKTSTTRGGNGGFIAHVLRNWFWYSIAAFIFWSLVNDKPKIPQPGPKPYQASPAPVKLVYAPPNSAPNGQPWPIKAAYVSGYQRLHTSGLSKVTVDNSQNDAAVFVKLVSLTGAKAYPVRTFYIPASGRFTLNSVTAGNYDVRYRNLSSGLLSRSEAFDLEETPAYDGTQFSNITMTLYKVRNGNMQTYALSEDEF